MTEAVEPDALLADLSELAASYEVSVLLSGTPMAPGTSIYGRARAALVALRGERDEALRQVERLDGDRTAASILYGNVEAERDALAASLDRVRALHTKIPDMAVVFQRMTPAQRKVRKRLEPGQPLADNAKAMFDADPVYMCRTDHRRWPCATAAALSPGEPPKEGNGHDLSAS